MTFILRIFNFFIIRLIDQVLELASEYSFYLVDKAYSSSFAVKDFSFARQPICEYLRKLSSHRHFPIEPRREKTGLRGFRPGPTQTGLYQLRKELEA